MAAPQQTARPVADGNSPVVIKVTHGGATHKTKMMLKDMVYPTLEYQLRHLLMIAPGQNMVLERYSDSSTAFVRLLPPPSTTYKQLYRAAKAKQKLKLRVVSESAPDATLKIEKAASPSNALPPPPNPLDLSWAQQLDTLEEALRKHGISPSLIDTPAASADDAATLKCEPEVKPEPQPAPSEASKVDSSVSESFESFKKSLLETTQKPRPASSTCPGALGAYTVCCNACDKMVSDVHYHCSTCDDGDYDLCSDCKDNGVICHSPNHWMIKRSIVNGYFVDSVTRTIRKPTPKLSTTPAPTLEKPVSSVSVETLTPSSETILRTCNCCLIELAEREFVHCNVCEDFDLCQKCFYKDTHGHHPKHDFVPAVKGTEMPRGICARMAAGRNRSHNAICDGCDKFIYGVRHKCIDCPDFDYCNACIPDAARNHPRHRFAPLYEPLNDQFTASSYLYTTHAGICCDGPLCAKSNHFIRGVRYKCSVCHDTDFCAGCEAHPGNTHNKSHPLIMMKTPIRHVSITTTGQDGSGEALPVFGDKKQTHRVSRGSPSSTARESEKAPGSRSNGHDLLDLTEVATKVKREAEMRKRHAEEVRTSFIRSIGSVPSPVPSGNTVKPEKIGSTEDDLFATFHHESVRDGTIMRPDEEFEQTWLLRNSGTTIWPAGCSVKFVGGDYMGIVPSTNAASIKALNEAAESTCCEDVRPNELQYFKIKLRAPRTAGKFVSYWRLTTPDGVKFGDRLWCEVAVREYPQEKVTPKELETVEKAALKETETETETEAEVKVLPKEPEMAPKSVAKKVAVEDAPEEEQTSQASSTMIFPKLEKESPAASIYQAAPAAPAAPASSIPDDKSTIAADDMSIDDEWDAQDSFLTDDEYDILDASDEDIPDDLHNAGRR